MRDSKSMPNLDNHNCASQGMSLINGDSALADNFPTSIIIKTPEICDQVGISIRFCGNLVQLRGLIRTSMMNRNRLSDMRPSPTLVSLFCPRLTNQLRSRLRAIYAILPWHSIPLFAVARHPPRLRILSPLTAGMAKPVMGHDLISYSPKLA